jgi:hypothetical protein
MPVNDLGGTRKLSKLRDQLRSGRPAIRTRDGNHGGQRTASSAVLAFMYTRTRWCGDTCQARSGQCLPSGAAAAIVERKSFPAETVLVVLETATIVG